MNSPWTRAMDDEALRLVGAALRADEDNHRPDRDLRRLAARLSLIVLASMLAAVATNLHTRPPAGSHLRPPEAGERNTIQERTMKLRSLGIAAAVLSANTAYAQNRVLDLEAGGHVRIPHHPSQVPGSKLTIEFWMRSLPSSAGRPVSKRPGDSGCYSIAVGSVNAQGLQGTAGEFFSCGNVAWMMYRPAEWHHFAYVCDGGVSVRYYLDGRLTDSAGVPACTITPGTYDLCFGITPQFPGTQFFGRLDNVRIWSTARTAAEIAQYALIELTPAEAAQMPGLIGSWSFDDGTAADARGVNNGLLQSVASVVIDDGPGANVDCNGNGVLDAYELATNALSDADVNGVPDCCESAPICIPCAGDVDGNGTVNGVDLAAVLTAWGTDGAKYPGSDTNRDGLVEGGDLAQVLSDWGACQ